MNGTGMAREKSLATDEIQYSWGMVQKQTISGNKAGKS